MLNINLRNNPEYISVQGEPNIEEDEITSRTRIQKNSVYAVTIPWILCAILTIFLGTTIMRRPSLAIGRYESGFVTEFGPAWSTIALGKVKFTNTLRAHENGSLYLPDAGEKGSRYTGSPSPRIDEAWDELLRYQFFYILDHEIETPAEDIYHVPQHGYPATLGVFHSLHCVNMIRKALDHDYYHPTTNISETQSRAHLDHCVDRIRQSIMCGGDVTAVLGLFSNHVKAGFSQVVASDREYHVCRDFNKIREWSKQRWNQSASTDHLKE